MRISAQAQIPLHKTQFLKACGHLQGAAELGIAPGRHREDELELTSFDFRQLGELSHIVQAQQPAISHHNDPLHRKALEHLSYHGLQRPRFGDVAPMHRVHQRQSVRALHHTEHKLAGDTAGLLVQAKGTHIVRNLSLAMNAYRGQIIEHHRQLLVEHGPQLPGDQRFNGFCPVHQRIHGTQQLVMGDCLGYARNRDRMQPLETTELRIGRAQTVKPNFAP